MAKRFNHLFHGSCEVWQVSGANGEGWYQVPCAGRANIQPNNRRSMQRPNRSGLRFTGIDAETDAFENGVCDFSGGAIDGDGLLINSFEENFNADGKYAWRTKDGHSTWRRTPRPFSGGGELEVDSDNFSADGDNEPTAAEGAEILYISPRVTGGKVQSMEQIEVRIREGLFSKGDVVSINHPNYTGEAEVADIWDAQDGGGTAIIDTPFIDTGERNVAPYEENPIDKSAGTISVIAEAADGSEEEYEEFGDTDFFAAIGKRKAKKKGIFKKFKGKRKRIITKKQAALRKKAKLIGKRKGLKGKALRKFIRKPKTKK